MARKKNLNVANLMKEDKKLDEQLKAVAGDYQFSVDKIFRNTKIMKLISEMITKMSHAKSKKIELEEIMIPYTFVLIMKHFTSFDIPEDLETQIAIIDMLSDRDLIEPISQGLPVDQVEKVFAKIKEILQRLDDNAEEMLAELEIAEQQYLEENGFVN